MMCQVMEQHLTRTVNVGGINVSLDVLCDDTFTNELKQTQSGVENLKKSIVS